jgi:two-component system, chemotaxis family, CheB/CheR fusion protein
LEAITALLKGLPANTGLALVLVQHLDPSHPSTLTEILSRIAHMPIEEVREGVLVKPDHAYVIPPNTEMLLKDGALHLVARQARGIPSLPIDRLFQSLATARGNRAIGVILSGTGSDGTEGCKAIKEAGGIVFAQAEATAKYSGMPQAAIGSGCVDFVLPPDKIAQKLAEIGSQPYIWDQWSEDSTPHASVDLQPALEIVSSRMGVDLAQYKPTTLQRRILRRMALLKIEQIRDYSLRLKDDPEELESLYRDLLISVTNFFREPAAFEALKKYVFGPLLV